jgi:hypothetical protein
MSWELDQDEREQFERYLFQIETSKLPRRRLALELYFAHRLLLAAKSCRKLPRALARIVQKFPRLSDREAWDRLSAEEQARGQLDALREELEIARHEFMREGFE